STPSRWCTDGPEQQPFATSDRCCARGSSGAIQGANAATTTKAPTRQKPTTAAGFRISRDQASRHRPPPPTSSATSTASSSTVLILDPGGRSRVADPRVDHRVREVDEQVHEHEDDRDEEDPALQDRVV